MSTTTLSAYNIHYYDTSYMDMNGHSGTYGQMNHNFIDEGQWYQTFFFVYLEVPATRIDERLYMCVRLAFLSLVLVTGLFGNIMTMLIMTWPSMRRQQISTRFATLAFCDFCCCLARFMPWINLIFALASRPPPLRFYNDRWCKFSEYFFSSLHIGESWLIGFITLERAFAVVFPMKGGILSQQSHGKYAIFFCVCGPFIMLCYLPFITVYVPGLGCAVKAFPDMLWHWIVGTTAVSAIPLTMILACNISLVLALRRQNVKVNSDTRAKKFKRVTNMVLAVSVAFLATVFPKASNVLMKFINPHWQWLQTSDDVASTLCDFNYAINFYLYVVTGKSMRKEIRKLFGCYLKKDSDSKQPVCSREMVGGNLHYSE